MNSACVAAYVLVTVSHRVPTAITAFNKTIICVTQRELTQAETEDMPFRTDQISRHCPIFSLTCCECARIA